MSAKILDGRALAKTVRKEAKQRAAELAERGVVPGIAVVMVGQDPASQIYVRNKIKAAKKIGVTSFDHFLPASTSQDELLDLVRRFNADDEVDGILVQLPLPKQIDPDVIQDATSPTKDVDGFHPENLGLLSQGRPRFVAATPKGCMRLLAEANVELAGLRATIVGRSRIVGKPMSMLLTNANCTVTVCHSRTRDLADEVARADIVVAAIGRAKMIRGEWIKPGAVVIDVGMNRDENDQLCGDVEFEVAVERAAAITPVPRGVGPMTIASVLENTVESAQMRLEGRR